MPYRSDAFSSSTSTMQHLQGHQSTLTRARPRCSETGLSQQVAEQAARSPPWPLLTSAPAHRMTCMPSWCPLFPRAGNPSHIWPQPIHPPKMARSAALTLVLPHFDFQATSYTFSSLKLGNGFHWVPPLTLPFWPHSRLY